MKLEGDQLMERETKGLGGVKGHERTNNGERNGQWGILLGLWAGSIESRLKK